MKRFITYVYIYDNGKKQKNVGFIKVDVSEDIFKLSVKVQNIGKYTGKCPVLLLGEDDDVLMAIEVGQIEIKNGSASWQLVSKKEDIAGSDIDLDDIVGVRINISDSIMLASCWNDDMADMISEPKKYVEWNPKINDIEEEQEINNVDEKEENEHIAQEVLPQNKEIKKINLSDIKNLPKKNWYLCNNSFLLHGFFNYKYLVIKSVVEEGIKKYYLGVPGVYERPEKAMALLFGFPEFEAENSNQPEPIGEFGYWYCILDI